MRTAELPDGVFGVTDWSSKTIIIDLRLTTAQARSTLAHELAHVDLRQILDEHVSSFLC